MLPLDEFVALRELIEERCGLHFDESQRGSLSASVTARMLQLGLDRPADYYERLRREGGPLVEAEFRNLISLVTVTETCFFRDPSQFRMLQTHILPALIAERLRGEQRTIRIWSAGCSSGEEAFSIAIALAEIDAYRAYPGWTFDIVGTDLNTRVLDAAERGVYSARSVRNVEGDLLQRYFRRDGTRFHLNDDIRARVRFEHGNLTYTPMPSTGPQDIVFCKNVAIYFREDLTRRLVRGLHDTLRDGGYLVLGHSESLWQMSDGFDVVEHDRAYCYRKHSSVVSGFGRTAAAKPDASVVSGFSRTVAVRRPGPFGPGAQSKPDSTDLYNHCLAAFRAGDLAAVEASLEGLIESCPTFVPAHLLLGGLHAHLGRYDLAAAQAEAVLQLERFEPRAHLLLGMVAARQQRYGEALQALRRALYLDDSLALAHFWLGNLYRDRGDLARASLEYQNVVRDWEHHTLELTEELAPDLSAERLVELCTESVQHLQETASYE